MCIAQSHTQTSTNIYVFQNISTHTHIHICIYIYIYIHTYIQYVYTCVHVKHLEGHTLVFRAKNLFCQCQRSRRLASSRRSIQQQVWQFVVGHKSVHCARKCVFSLGVERRMSHKYISLWLGQMAVVGGLGMLWMNACCADKCTGRRSSSQHAQAYTHAHAKTLEHQMGG